MNYFPASSKTAEVAMSPRVRTRMGDRPTRYYGHHGYTGGLECSFEEPPTVPNGTKWHSKGGQVRVSSLSAPSLPGDWVQVRVGRDTTSCHLAACGTHEVPLSLQYSTLSTSLSYNCNTRPEDSDTITMSASTGPPNFWT